MPVVTSCTVGHRGGCSADDPYHDMTVTIPENLKAKKWK